jgi:UDP-N-acetylmuramyl pentapeptide phosphotransferase/UDP-N-acetylglucosamine-1-phosphate transferase
LRSFLTILVAFGASVGLTHLFLRWLEGRSIVAVENHRTMHKGAVPTGGGWPLLAATLFTTVALWQLELPQILLLLAAIVLAFVSWADDLKTLDPGPRLAVHMGAAALAMYVLPSDAYVFHGALPFVLDRLLAGLALVWFLNLYNFMDGIDGIAGIETITIAVGYASINAVAGEADAFYGLALALAAATAGFLVWNWAPARIFMGDVGSVPLGFLTGALMIDLAIRHSLAAALILPLYFVADATITILKRIHAGKPLSEAHRDHYYQRAAQRLGAHEPVVLRVALANAVLLIAAVLAVTAPFPAAVMAVAVVTALLANLERAARNGAARTHRRE